MTEFWREELADAAAEYEKALEAAKAAGLKWLGSIVAAPEIEVDGDIEGPAKMVVRENGVLVEQVGIFTERATGSGQ